MAIMTRNRDTSSVSTPLPLNSSQRNRSIATSRPSTYESIKTAKPWMTQSSSSLYSSSGYYSQYTASIENNKNNLWKLSACVILMFLPWIPNVERYNTIQTQRQQLQGAILEQHDLASKLHEVTDALSIAKNQLHDATSHNEKSYKKLKKLHGALDLESAKYLAAEETEEMLLNRMEKVEKTIQENDRKNIERKYGKEQVRVEIQLKIGEDSPSSVILELNSKQMPHASYHFLQMVESHLWEGLPLARGMDDRFVASPSVMDEHHHSGLSRFTKANLTHLAFQEYTEPILQKYSVAFAGSRPAGPVFVIRMLESKGEDEMHEATFATVVEGHDVLDRFMSRPLETGSIKMEHVRVVNQPTSPVTQPGVRSSRL